MGGSSISKNVLVAIDGSKNAANAFHWYIKNSPEVRGDNIILFHTLSAPSNISITEDGDLDFDVSDLDIDVEKMKSEAVGLESIFMNECKQNQLNCKWINRWGKPKQAILKAVDKYEAHLVVLGSRGLSTLSRTLLGSVSDYVLHHVKVPVIIVPMRLHSDSST